MNSGKANNLFLILGIIALLLGILMIVSHIKSGSYFIMFGIVILCLTIIPGIFTSIISPSNKVQSKYYPNITQSVILTAINILIALLVIIKLKPGLNTYINTEATNFICEILIVGITLGIASFNRKRFTNYNAFDFKIENLRIVPFIIIVSVVLLFGITSPLENFIPVPESFKKSMMDFGSQNGIFSFLLLVFAAPILEELLFRGIILDGLLKRYTSFVSILISSLLFGIVHLNPWSFINGIGIGIFSGWVYFKTRSVLPSIIIHASVNLSGFLLRLFVDIPSLINK